MVGGVVCGVAVMLFFLWICAQHSWSKIRVVVLSGISKIFEHFPFPPMTILFFAKIANLEFLFKNAQKFSTQLDWDARPPRTENRTVAATRSIDKTDVRLRGRGRGDRGADVLRRRRREAGATPFEFNSHGVVSASCRGRGLLAATTGDKEKKKKSLRHAKKLINCGSNTNLKEGAGGGMTVSVTSTHRRSVVTVGPGSVSSRRC